MELDAEKIDQIHHLMIETVVNQHMDEFVEIFGDGVSHEQIRIMLRPMAKHLLMWLAGGDDEQGIIKNATGTYGHKILFNTYKEWLTNNEEDVKNTIDMLKVMRGNNDVE